MVGMSSDGYIDPADDLAEECEREHTRPDPECSHCQYRLTLTHCAQCGADFVDGEWWVAGSRTPNGCDHEALVDDWDREVRCEAPTRLGVLADPRRPSVRCGDAVTTPGRSLCSFHARIADQEECARIYQRMVAAS